MKNSQNPQNLTKKERRALKKQSKFEEQAKKAKSGLVKKLSIWTVAFALLGAGLFGIVKLVSQSPDDSNIPLTDTVNPSDWTKGNSDSAVTLIEYSDFQCPACGSFFPLLKQLNEELGDKMQFVYRHFPLKQIHKNAELAGRAAEAAGKQEKFWEMHDMLFINQNEWAESGGVKEIFSSYAGELGLDTELFLKDMDSGEVKDKVENDRLSGLRAQVNATPTFFLNGVKLQHPRSYNELKGFVQEALQQK